MGDYIANYVILMIMLGGWALYMYILLVYTVLRIVRDGNASYLEQENGREHILAVVLTGWLWCWLVFLFGFMFGFFFVLIEGGQFLVMSPVYIYRLLEKKRGRNL